MEKEGFVYIWFDRKHKRYYVGCHWGTIDDGYICSSSWMKQAYEHRPHDFKRRIIQKGITRDNLLNEEYKWLSLIPDEELGESYYNLSKKHFGHWSAIESNNLSVREKLSEASKKLHQDPVYKEKFLEGRKKMPPQTSDQIAKRTKSNTGKKRSEETKQKIADAHRGKIMGPLSEETKQKIAQKLTGTNNPFYGKTHDPELKKIMNEKTSQTMKGRMPANIELFSKALWWNNGTINKRSMVCPADGWLRGRKAK
jgi:hypothetical protein